MSLVTDTPIWAAGATPLRGPQSDREVLIVHRPAYDDWSLPKGKAHPRELMPATAVREVVEETAAQIRLGAPLTPIRYPLVGAMKLVSWWVGVPQLLGQHYPNREVDRTAWVSAEEALATLSYADERAVLSEALALPDTTALVIVRHAKALQRQTWKKADHLRPLSPRGRDQLPYISQLLKPFGVTHLVSSAATRCVQTLTPYAKSIKAKISTTSVLTEEDASIADVSGYMTRLARAVGASGTSTVVCGHRPVLPTMLSALGIAPQPMATSACVVAHLDSTGAVVRTEWYDTLRVKL
jgi:8-oxo-dGTP diphosphatase